MPFCKTSLKTSKPLSLAYPKALKTLGDHLRKKRLGLKLLQKDVGHQLGVNKDTIYNWETNRISPSLAHISKIIRFLGYIPWKVPEGDIRGNRQVLGISQKALAKAIGVDPGTLARWESGTRKPTRMFIRKLKEFFNTFDFHARKNLID